MNSGRAINYALRPAKSVERKMICEFMHKSSVYYADISKYTYIGFGSYYFSDFALFHKSLGINKMYSIEQDTAHKARYDFNKPYSCITMQYESSSTILNNILQWDEEEKYFIWLDYDGCFSNIIIDDFRTCINKLSNGSYICISFSLGNIQSEQEDFLYNFLVEIAGEYLSPKLSPKDIYKTNFANAIWDILSEAGKDAINRKNAGLESKSKDKYTLEPIMFFKYKDGAPMMTVCYMVAKNQERRFLINANVSQLEFVSRTNQHYNISVPPLTWLEVRKINSLLPANNVNKIRKALSFIDRDDLEKYMKFYKYYPNYLEGQDTL